MAKFNINIPQGKPVVRKERTWDGPYEEDPKKTYDEEGAKAMQARNTHSYRPFSEKRKP